MEGKTIKEQEAILANSEYVVKNGLFLEKDFDVIRGECQEACQQKIDEIVEKLLKRTTKLKPEELPGSIFELADKYKSIPVYDLCNYLFLSNGESPKGYLKKKGILRDDGLYVRKRVEGIRTQALEEGKKYISINDSYVRHNPFFEASLQMLFLGKEANRYCMEEGMVESFLKTSARERMISFFSSGKKVNKFTDMPIGENFEMVENCYTISEDESVITYQIEVDLRDAKADSDWINTPVYICAKAHPMIFGQMIQFRYLKQLGNL